MTRLLLLLGCCIGVLAPLAAQTFTDALRYSFTYPQGTARFMGTGGSLTPMGVDVTTLHTNPAGIGWNRYDLVEVTPGFTLTNTDASVLFDEDGGNPLGDGRANFSLPSLGIVLAGQTRSVNWRTFNFAIGLTRVAEYNQQISFEGRTAGSIIETFTETLNSGVFDEFGGELAREFVFEDDQGFFSDFLDLDTNEPRADPIGRSGTFDRRGGMSELAFGIGGNYRDRFLWGVSVGVPFVNFEQRYEYEELDDADLIPSFESSAYTQSLVTQGNGINAKLGFIFLPTQQLRVSAAIHTPTLWNIDEDFTTTFTYNFIAEDGSAAGGTRQSPQGLFSYNLSSPWRFQVGVGSLIGKAGFVSLDADYTDYTGNSFSFDDFATEATDLNESIDGILASSIGARLGGELNLKPFQVRAGVGYRQIPFAEYIFDVVEFILTYSAGFGYSRGKFFADLAASYGTYAAFEDAYTPPAVGGNTIITDRARTMVLLTVGFRGFDF